MARYCAGGGGGERGVRSPGLALAPAGVAVIVPVAPAVNARGRGRRNFVHAAIPELVRLPDLYAPQGSDPFKRKLPAQRRMAARHRRRGCCE